MCGTGSLTGRLSISWMISKYQAALEYYRQGKTEGVAERPVRMPLCPLQISH